MKDEISQDPNKKVPFQFEEGGVAAPADSEGSLVELGTTLRREREARGITLDEVSRVTRINVKYLQAIEMGRKEGLPAVPFLKGFICAYAKYLGLDADEMVSLLDAVVGPPPTVAAGTWQPAEEESAPAKGRPRWVWVGGLVLALILVLLAIFIPWKRAEKKSESGAQPKRVETPAASLPVAPEVPVPAVSGSAGAEPPSVPAESVAAPPAQPSAAGHVRLLLKASQRVWFRAVADEKTAREKTLQAGEEMALDADHSISLTLGNAGGVTLDLNGRSLGAPGKAGEVKKDILFTWSAEKGAEMAIPAAATTPGQVP